MVQVNLQDKQLCMLELHAISEEDKPEKKCRVFRDSNKVEQQKTHILARKARKDVSRITAKYLLNEAA